MSDLDHPLDAYANHFQRLHARNVREHFEQLVRDSGVDEEENRRLVGEFRSLEAEAARVEKLRNAWRAAGIAGITAVVGLLGVALAVQGAAFLLLIPAIAAGLFTLLKVRPMLASVNSELERVVSRRDSKRREAWEQMEPLNRLHDWGVAPALFQTTFPEVQFDPHVTGDRVRDLVSNYGLSPNYGDGRSALFSQGGSLNGNPLVFQRSLHHWIGNRTYTGSLVIHWTEQVRNSDGRYVNVRRSQTLYASVDKPYPEFQASTDLIYGHEAAPGLSFTRTPSELSGLEEGLFNDWRKNRRLKKVEKQARREVKTSGGQLTVMANTEFEALFHATDRDDEIAFRLLFTPLAQQEMVALLNDRTTGFGDDFTFAKLGAVNIIQASHLQATRIAGDPAMFRSHELAEARRFFAEFHAAYFKSLYFSLAPLLTIPLYREARSIPEPGGQPSLLETSEWEHEAMANLIGDAAFKHPESITGNLLKTTSAEIAPGVRSVEVTAHGYRGVDRVDYIYRRGGDGNVHAVPVPWVEYFAVRASRTMLVGVVDRALPREADSQHAEGPEQEWEDALLRYGLEAGDTIARGSLAAALPQN